MSVGYRNGGEGMIKWCEDYVYIPVASEEITDDSQIVVNGESEIIKEWMPLSKLSDKPNSITGKSSKDFWDNIKIVIKEALKMKNGKFLYRLIILCWMRGESKSLLACLIQLWKFFNFPSQKIMLGANSKDQVRFVHYDIMRDIILNSPELKKIVGKRNIREKEIRLRDKKGDVISFIRAISSFSGIVSNITGYTFSEIFDMRNPRFFVQLDGSIRSIPNALGVIDSTVSSRNHVLFQMYSNAKKGLLKKVFFSYRYSKKGDPADYWNPNTNEDELNDYRIKFPFGEFEKYFLNLWTSGINIVFTDEMIEEMEYLGMDGGLLNHAELISAIKEKADLYEAQSKIESKLLFDGAAEIQGKINKIDNRIRKVDSVYKLSDSQNQSIMATLDDLNKLSDVFDTEWIIGGGIDMADPMAIRSNARTMFSLVAKGLPSSRSNPVVFDDSGKIPVYIYLLLYLVNITNHSLEDLKKIMDLCHDEFDGIDALCGERWGIWDLAPWCEERDILFEAVYPTYDRQKEAFKELYISTSQGRVKTPKIVVPGSKSDNILKEEMGIFDHDDHIRWFGSPEKAEKYGIQDDCVYSLAWSLYGMRLLGADDFRPRKSVRSFGVFIGNRELLGNY